MINFSPFYKNPISMLFFRKAPEDDLIVKVAKIAHRILEYLFHLVEVSVNYLIKDLRPRPFLERYKWSFRISVIAITTIGLYYGSQYIKQRAINYFYSFVPSFNFFDKTYYKHFLDYVEKLFKKPDSNERGFNPNQSNAKEQKDGYSYFTLENIQALILKIVDTGSYGKKILRLGIYESSYMLLKRLEVDKPEFILKISGNIVSFLAVSVGLYKIGSQMHL